MYTTGDGDQHPHPTKQDEHTGPKLDEGKENSHVGNDYHDQRSLSNRANAEKAQEKAEKKADEAHEEALKHPTSIARSHGEL